jgi:hypothetical protein
MKGDRGHPAAGSGRPGPPRGTLGTMEANRTTEQTVARLRAAAVGFASFRGAIEAGRPWPLHDVADGDGPEAEWGPTEVLAHVSEMLPFWLGEIERVIDGSPEPTPFGRIVTDRIRVLSIERDRTLPPAELLDRIVSAVDRYARRLERMTPTDLARRGLHPTQGELSVADMIERFALSHAEGHVTQLSATLGSSASEPRSGA